MRSVSVSLSLDHGCEVRDEKNPQVSFEKESLQVKDVSVCVSLSLDHGCEVRAEKNPQVSFEKESLQVKDVSVCVSLSLDHGCEVRAEKENPHMRGEEKLQEMMFFLAQRLKAFQQQSIFQPHFHLETVVVKLINIYLEVGPHLNTNIQKKKKIHILNLSSFTGQSCNILHKYKNISTLKILSK